MVAKRTSTSARGGAKTLWQRVWYFLWQEDSVASWVVSLLLAFVLIKFAIYPLMGLVFGTQFPVVAVVSDSMEHDGSFDTWWARQEDLYLQFNITKNDFHSFPMRSGFNKGDIIILVGTAPEKIKQGDIIVFWGGKEYPIIHRVVALGAESSGGVYFQTKGDHNLGQINTPPQLNERHIPSSALIGRAALRVPYLGWVKIGFVNLMRSLGVNIS